MVQEFVKDKEALRTDLIACALSAHIPAENAWGDKMEGKARFILATIMSSMMVFMVTLLVTCLNLGFPPDFLSHWVKAYFIAWPVAATTAFLVMPMARRATEGLLKAIGT